MDTVKINSGNVKMIAHRGASALERENTVAAFIAAGQRTYYGIETDVHVTADGKFAIIHDNTTARVAGGIDLPVEGSTLAELQAVPLLDMNGVAGRIDLRVPELGDYVTICHRYEKESILELKGRMTDRDIAGIVDVIRSLDHLDNTTFISFSPENLLDLRRLFPDVKCQLLPGKEGDWILPYCVENRIDLDIYHGALTKEIVDIVHKAGLKVNCWTVDDPAAAERAIEMGVDFITPNRLE